MKLFKNIGVGFLVSFIGSVPLGYLNIAGYEIFSSGGWAELIPYLCGVIVVEAVTIYATVVFAEKLSKRKKLIQYIEIFSIVFMLTLALIFFFSSGHHEKDNFFRKYFNHPPFIIGIILSAINFMQIPFWIAWNLYVVNKKYISVELPMRLAYVGGTLIGNISAEAVNSCRIRSCRIFSRSFSWRLPSIKASAITGNIIFIKASNPATSLIFTACQKRSSSPEQAEGSDAPLRGRSQAN